MKVLLDRNGVEYSQVSLQSVYISSVSLTFRIDLPAGDQGDNITQLSSFLGNTEQFSSFNDYSVTEGGRGLVDVSVAGIWLYCYMTYIHTYVKQVLILHALYTSTETCSCLSANLGSSLQLCSGAAISPCDCTDTVCMV